MFEAFQKSRITRRPDQSTDIDTLLIELLGNVRAEESRCSRQQDSHRLDHPELPTGAPQGPEAPIEVFAFMGGHVAGSEQGVPG